VRDRAPLAVALLLCAATALAAFAPEGSAPPPPPFASKLREAVNQHLGRPYVWGATGLKSFDCSGFVWRVLCDAGLMVKRTTARRYYLCLKAPEKGREYEFGNLVFFSDLEHVGMIDTRDAFFHAQTSKGTNRSPFDPYWRQKVYGFRTIPAKE